MDFFYRVYGGAPGGASVALSGAARSARNSAKLKEMAHVDLFNSSDAVETATPDRPLDYLMAWHRRAENILSVLERAASLPEDQRTEEALRACRLVFAGTQASGLLHIEDEEESVFPRIRLKAKGEEIPYLDSLELQHRELEGCLARLKNLITELDRDPSSPLKREAFVQTVVKLIALYRAHIASEDEALIRFGRARLDEAALAEIAVEMRLRRSPGA